MSSRCPPQDREGKRGGEVGRRSRPRTCLSANRCCSCCCRFHWLCWMSSSMDGAPWAAGMGAAGASGGCGRGGRAAAGSSSGACCLQMTGRRRKGGLHEEVAPLLPLGQLQATETAPAYTHHLQEGPCAALHPLPLHGPSCPACSARPGPHSQGPSPFLCDITLAPLPPTIWPYPLAFQLRPSPSPSTPHPGLSLC